MIPYIPFDHLFQKTTSSEKRRVPTSHRDPPFFVCSVHARYFGFPLRVAKRRRGSE